MVVVVLPYLCMFNDPSPPVKYCRRQGRFATFHRVKININHAANQVFIGIHCRGVIAVFPKGSIPVFTTIVSLGCPSDHKLQGTWNNLMVLIPIRK